jgi:hypothetical protein
VLARTPCQDRPEQLLVNIDYGVSIHTHTHIDIRRCTDIPSTNRLFIRLIACSFDQSLPLSLIIRFLLSPGHHSVLSASTGRYLSTMSYDHTTKCLVCPRHHDAAPCTHCECSRYCSDECKVVDLPVHRTLCKSFAQFSFSPTMEKRRAIYLPVHGPNPEFVWLEMDENTAYSQPNVTAMDRDFLGSSKDQFHFRIEQDMLSMTTTESGYPEITLVYGSVPPYTDQPLNKSISTLLGQEVHGIRGPVIAYGEFININEDGEKERFVTDLDTTDLAIITNWFLGIHREVEVTMPYVSLLSNRDQRTPSLAFGSASTMTASFLYCSGQWGIMSQISIHFGMPLMVILQYGVPNSGDPMLHELAAERVSELPPDSGNRAVALLLIYMGNHVESADEEFGTIPEQCVTCHTSIRLLRGSPIADMNARSGSAVSWDLPMSSAKI